MTELLDAITATAELRRPHRRRHMIVVASLGAAVALVAASAVFRPSLPHPGRDASIRSAPIVAPQGKSAVVPPPAGRAPLMTSIEPNLGRRDQSDDRAAKRASASERSGQASAETERGAGQARLDPQGQSRTPESRLERSTTLEPARPVRPRSPRAHHGTPHVARDRRASADASKSVDTEAPPELKEPAFMKRAR
jgi:hypothetical protein